MGDIINMRGRRKELEVEAEVFQKAPVMDITDLREKQINEDRREAKRTILDGFIGATVVVPGRGLLKVSLFDISKGGLAFDMGTDSGHFRENEEVAFRFYINQSRYFPFVARITSFRINADEGVCRHGATFVSDLSNIPALHHFVDFLESVSLELKTDKGDLFITGHGM